MDFLCLSICFFVQKGQLVYTWARVLPYCPIVYCIFIFSLLMTTYKQLLLSSIATYYHTHPHDTKASSFFQIIHEINNESTLALLRERMKQALHRVQVERLTKKQHAIDAQHVLLRQQDNHEAEALLSQLT